MTKQLRRKRRSQINKENPCKWFADSLRIGKGRCRYRPEKRKHREIELKQKWSKEKRIYIIYILYKEMRAWLSWS